MAKKGRVYTIRGAFPFVDGMAFPVLEPQRIPLWNGSWKDNWVIEEVQVIMLGTEWTTNTMMSQDLSALVIATEESGAISDFSSAARIRGRSCRDNRQVWWGSYASNDTTQNVLDPDHLFVQDLWINGWYVDNDTGVRYALNQEIGYVIKLRATRTTIEQTVLALIKEQAQEVADSMQPIADAVDSIASSLGDLFSQAASNIADTISESETELDNLDARIAEATTERERSMLEGRKRMIEEEIKEQKKAALAMFVAQKVTAISQAAVATALAIITGFAQGGPPLAVAAAIAGGIAIATIAAEPPPSFHAGGMVSMGAPDEITARLLRSEAVLSPQGVAAAGGEDGVRDLNRGAGGQQPVISVLQVRSRVVDAMISDNLRMKQGPLTDALRAARPRALGRHNPFASS